MRLDTKKCLAILSFVFCGCTGHVLADTAPPTKDTSDLFEKSIEELQRVKITVSSVSKREESLFEAPSAISVITSEDIRRSGLTSLPDLLRMSPGTNIAQLNSQKHMVAVRGFMETYTNKLLVLVDGRSVYTPLFGGVYWEVQDYPLEDIERIEIIRGSAATLWGSNAVNGVINIISKDAKNTQGTLLSGAGGTDQSYLARHGGKINDTTYYRLYAKHTDRGHLVDANGQSTNDSWDINSGGFQVSGSPTHQNQWVLQGRVYGGGGDIQNHLPTIPAPTDRLDTNSFSGGHLLGRWDHDASKISRFTFQAYYDRTHRNERPLYQENRDTGDLDFQHHYTFSKNDIVWGLGYRVTRDQKFKPGLFITNVDPSHRTESTTTAFVQDEIKLKDKFRVTVGSKFEHNAYTKFEAQPSARFLWLPHDNHTVWGAASRALRIPARLFRDSTLDVTSLPAGALGPGSPPLLSEFRPSKAYDSEKQIALELGYRIRPIDTIFMDVTVFRHLYRKMQGIRMRMEDQEPVPAIGPPSYVIQPLMFTNTMKVAIRGFEGLAEWQVFPAWKLRAVYSTLKIHGHPTESDPLDVALFWKNSGHRHQFQLHSYWNLPHGVELGLMGYAVSSLPGFGVMGNPGAVARVPGYTRLDARIGWRPFKNLILEAVGQRLLDKHYSEVKAATDTYTHEEVKRAFYAQATLDL